LLTALALLVMAAGLWFGGPVASAREGSVVPAPRLHAAEAHLAATERAMAADPAEPAMAAAPAEPATAADPAGPATERVAGPAPDPVAAVTVAPVVAAVAAPLAAVPPAVAGPRAPPHG
jgi:ribonuclease E